MIKQLYRDLSCRFYLSCGATKHARAGPSSRNRRKRSSVSWLPQMVVEMVRICKNCDKPMGLFGISISSYFQAKPCLINSEPTISAVLCLKDKSRFPVHLFYRVPKRCLVRATILKEFADGQPHNLQPSPSADHPSPSVTSRPVCTMCGCSCKTWWHGN
jgi:hypothetical protein